MQTMRNAQAFVLLDTSFGSRDKVLRELEKVEGIDEAHLLRDAHDIILRVRANNIKESQNLVDGQIKTISGIRSAIVLVIKVEYVEDIMAKEVITVDLDKTVLDAAVLMSERKLGYLIVVDGKTPVGIVTPNDFVGRVMAKKTQLDTKISEIMSKPLIIVEPDDTMQDAARIMVNHKIGKLPVIKENKLVGLLTIDDFANYLGFSKTYILTNPQ
jgi:CBS domain-containing protein